MHPSCPVVHAQLGPLLERTPQSLQSEPQLHEAHSAPTPPSSQSPSIAYWHVLEHTPGGKGGGEGETGGYGGKVSLEKPHAMARGSYGFETALPA
eukprot:CAMPEP_0174746600 /NCGR_PEP_ID=MMETSP1094-20130205/89422_1 /TAXON_ID=156173 /ORGANISM="Chrysochromulina brevifilum, Strain UTEX LB 985" /LENGTH=94 /DNA_ID=CAMNT_0015951341 /DNA_START=79 /DNA_END=363 /DNA_ORIENTATION=+